MNCKRLFTWFASTGLVVALPASAPAGSLAEGAAAAATPVSVSSVDWSDAGGATLPAGATAEWWAQAQDATRRLPQSNRDVAAPIRPRPSWKAKGDQMDAHFGYSVGTAGDVNGDGYDDLIVGAFLYDNGEANEGRVFVYHGSVSGPSVTPDWTAESDQADADFGWHVGTAGDVNGDGYDDVIIGAPFYVSLPGEGRAFVYHGSAFGLSASPNWTAESNQLSSYFGTAVGTAGDVNNDGYDDVVIGAFFYDNGETNEGRAFVYHGSPAGLSITSDWTAEGNQADAEFGDSVGTAGDVNGDGYDDIIVGASRYDNGQTDEGSAFVYHGSASGLSATPDWTAEGNQSSALFGSAVGTAGDVNSDGYDDVIVGAFNYDAGQTNEGRAVAYHGSSSGLSVTADWTAESDQADAIFGGSLGTAGDVNGDGYDDVVVGSHFYDNGQRDEGRAFLFHGTASGLSMTPQGRAESDQERAFFGNSVGTAGDVNKDGYDDVIIGASYYGQRGEGGAVVFRGRATAVAPR